MNYQKQNNRNKKIAFIKSNKKNQVRYIKKTKNISKNWKSINIKIIENNNTFLATIKDVNLEDIKSLMNKVEYLKSDNLEFIKLVLIKKLNSNNKLNDIYNEYIERIFL